MKQTLHLLINNSIPELVPNDATVVLMQEAVYLLAQPLPFATIFAISDDLLPRGLSAVGAIAIDYNALVVLSAEYQKVITWT